jgi:pimeloyl-ACP methyl ester carboxylesterase
MHRACTLPLLLVALAFAGACASSATAATRPAFHDGCGTKAERARAVVFRAPAGPRLVGLLLGSGKTGVVLAHERGATLCRWLPFARVLVKSGYRVLAFDFSDHGSSGPANRAGGGIDREVVAAGRLLAARGVEKVFVAGASMGGTAAIVAAPSLAPQLAGVVSLSGPAQLGALDARAVAPSLAVAVLFVAAADDAPFADDAGSLFAAVQRPDKSLEIVPGSAHGTSLVNGSDGAHVRGLLLAFLAKASG